MTYITFSDVVFQYFASLVVIYVLLLNFLRNFTTVRIKKIRRLHFEVTVNINQQYDAFELCLEKPF